MKTSSGLVIILGLGIVGSIVTGGNNTNTTTQEPVEPDYNKICADQADIAKNINLMRNNINYDIEVTYYGYPLKDDEDTISCGFEYYLTSGERQLLDFEYDQSTNTIHLLRYTNRRGEFIKLGKWANKW